MKDISGTNPQRTPPPHLGEGRGGAFPFGGGLGWGFFFRNLRRGGIYSVINITGLAVGLTASLLILIWIEYQWSFNRFHAKEKQLYQVMSSNESMGSFSNTPKILAPTLLDELPEIAHATRYSYWEELYTFEDKKLNIATALVDPGFLQMFTFPLLQGDAHTALNDPNSVILTEKAAKRIFGTESPMGKTITIRADYPVMVTGVMADVPGNSSLSFDAVLPFTFLKRTGEYEESWGNYSTFTYIELQEQADEAGVDKAMKDVFRKHVGEDKTLPLLHHISKWHLYSRFENGKEAGGRIESLRMFGTIASLILLIACINFINLATARSAKRAREVGVRKVIGAKRQSLIRQFLGESILVTAIAAAISLMLVYLCLPVFSNLMGQTLHIKFEDSRFWLAFLLCVLVTGVLAGGYPAFYLSSFAPLKAIKGIFTGGRALVTPRKVLIVTQFVCAVVLITATLTIHRQVQHAQERHIGYNKNRLLCIDLNDKMNTNQELIRRELVHQGIAASMTRTMGPMTEQWSSTWGMGWKGKNPEDKTMVSRYYVDTGWAETTGVEIIQGRDIDINTYATDSTAMLLNESAVKLMGFDNPLGEIIQDVGKDWHVVGIIKDFIQTSPYEPVKPMAIGGPAGWFNCVHVKLADSYELAGSLQRVGEVFKTYNPDYPFMYKFVDQSYALKFSDEQRIGTLVTWFAALAVFISCLGLFGLSAYIAENRRKEIGVRKVLGASIVDITSLLSREFMALVIVSLAIAIPVAWWAMSQWLAGYAYRTNIPWWLFAAVAALTVGIALVTVSFQAIKAAMADPATAIKSE